MSCWLSRFFFSYDFYPTLGHCKKRYGRQNHCNSLGHYKSEIIFKIEFPTRLPRRRQRFAGFLFYRFNLVNTIARRRKKIFRFDIKCVYAYGFLRLIFSSPPLGVRGATFKTSNKTMRYSLTMYSDGPRAVRYYRKDIINNNILSFFFIFSLFFYF